MDTFFIATEVDNSDHKNKIYLLFFCQLATSFVA